MKTWPIILVVSILVAAPIPSASNEAEKLREAEEQEFQKIKSNPKQFRDIVSVTQAALGALGYGTGPFDGNYDRKTADAIRRYQLARNLKQTGDLDVSTTKMAAEDFTEYH